MYVFSFQLYYQSSGTKYYLPLFFFFFFWSLQQHHDQHLIMTIDRLLTLPSLLCFMLTKCVNILPHFALGSRGSVPSKFTMWNPKVRIQEPFTKKWVRFSLGLCVWQDPNGIFKNFISFMEGALGRGYVKALWFEWPQSSTPVYLASLVTGFLEGGI